MVSYPDYVKPNFWFYALRFSSKKLKEDVVKRLDQIGIQVRPMWPPNHLQKPYSNYNSENLEISEKYWDVTINLPCSVGMTKEDIKKVCSVIKDFK